MFIFQRCMPMRQRNRKIINGLSIMPAKKQPVIAQQDSSRVTLFHLRTYLGIFIFSMFFLFYPGDSRYMRLFSHQRSLFATAPTPVRDYPIDPIPYMISTIPTPFTTAQGVYVIDLKTATPLYEKNPHGHLFPASTTKVITALTAMDMYTLDQVLTVRRVVDEGQTMGLVQGERITFENLLYGTLVQSGNDAAYVLADNYPRGYSAFIDAMNQKARSLGMDGSNFQNPAGLDNALQHSSVFDLSLAGRELLKNGTLAKIVSIKSITVSDVDYVHFHPLQNVNRLLGEIPGVAGLKTGKTDLAGENLITLYKYRNKEYLIVLMKSEDRFLDTTALVTWIQNAVNYQDPQEIQK